MVKKIGFLFLVACGIVVNQPAHAQGHICTISSSGGHCPGETVSFSLDCFGHEYEVGGLNSVVWLVNGQGKDSKGVGGSDPNPFDDFDFVFPGTGNYTVQAILYAVNGPSPYDNPTTTFEVMAAAAWPSVSANKTSFCDHGSVTFSVTNPTSGFNYSWSSTPVGFSGSGTTITFNNVTQSTNFEVTVDDCEAKHNDIYVSVLTTYNTLVLDPDKSAYHVRKLFPSLDFIGLEKLQFGSPLNTDDVSGNGQYYTATDAGTYYLRLHFNDCWANASPGLVVPNDFNFAPTTPVIQQIHKPGYTTLLLANPDAEKAIMLKYANYYWVNGNNSTEILGKFGDGDKASAAGTFYLRGRDISTNTWSNTISVQVQLLGDEGINWVYTSQFDGTSSTTPYAESKSYFDEMGRGVQSQTKMHPAGKANFVFTTATLRDKYDRVVGISLPAPIPQNDFKYNAAFLLNNNSDFYGPEDFDTGTTLYQPGAVSTNPGTAGWYYSANNTLEPLTPQTKFPYSRTEFYTDGTGEVKRSTSPGDAFILGAGHEVLSGTIPVSHELDDYLTLRRDPNKINMRDNLRDGQGTPIMTLQNNGVQSVLRDQNGRYAISISDKSGKVVMTARSGTSDDYDLAVNNQITGKVSQVEGPVQTFDFKWAYFYLLQPTTVTIGSNGQSYKIEDMVNSVLKSGSTFAGTDGKWPAGFYRAQSTDPHSNIVISFVSYYKDIAYNFYDDAGHLKVSVSPNGFKQLKAGIAAYANIDKTTYEYNHQGWLLAMNEPDAGRTEYIYRKDGKIRFSQNAQQRLDHNFSYTNYDIIGRPIESGEYIGTVLQFSTLSGDVHYQVLGEVDDAGDSPDNTFNHKKDWVKTFYNGEGASFSSIPGLADFSQTFVRGAVSYSENANIQTWYSYDEMGRLIVMAQKPKVLPLSFKVSYFYDFLGNVQSVLNLTFHANEDPNAAGNGSLADQFYHYYEYDADKRLHKAYTATIPNGDKKLRATYEYYLHGPLKRIVLGDKLQGLDFIYNINGWLTQINHPDKTRDPGHDGSGNGVREDVFGMVLDYYESDLDNLYLTGASSDVHDPSRRHHMPFGTYNAVAANHQPLIRFASPFQLESAPQFAPMSDYSVQNPKYKKMIEESQRYRSTGEIGKDN